MKKAVIFDLDGTLLNTLDDLTDSTNYVLNYFNFPTRTKEEIRTFVGNGVAKLIERAIPDGINNINYNKCIQLFKETYSKNMYNKTEPYKGIIEMLNTLKTSGYLIAVVSNKFDTAVKELCQRYFQNMIDFAAGENEAAGVRKKPFPDTIFKVLEEFKLNNNECIYIGDSEVDIQTAKNSNMDSISVTWGFKSRDFLTENNAQIIIDSPSEILDILNK